MSCYGIFASCLFRASVSDLFAPSNPQPRMKLKISSGYRRPTTGVTGFQALGPTSPKNQSIDDSSQHHSTQALVWHLLGLYIASGLKTSMLCCLPTISSPTICGEIWDWQAINIIHLCSTVKDIWPELRISHSCEHGQSIFFRKLKNDLRKLYGFLRKLIFGNYTAFFGN